MATAIAPPIKKHPNFLICNFFARLLRISANLLLSSRRRGISLTMSLGVKASEDLERDGFAVVSNVLLPDDLRAAEVLLDELFAKFDLLSDERSRRSRLIARDMAPDLVEGDHADQPEILYPAALDPRLRDTALFRKVEALAREIGGAVDYCFDHAIFKTPHNKSQTDWHQDIALSRIGRVPLLPAPRRYHFWVPLHDITPESGCMEFIAGSHRGPRLHHTKIERSRGEAGWTALEAMSAGPRVACPIAAGSLTIHDPRTLHFTSRNDSDRWRKAWIIHFSRLGQIELGLKRALRRTPRALAASRHQSA